MTYHTIVRSCALVGLLGLTAACGGTGLEPKDDDTRPRDVEITISAMVSPAVTSVAVEVAAEDINPAIVQNLVIQSDGVATGTVTIPAGSNRVITVRAFDRNGIRTHEGHREMDIEPDGRVTVELDLEPLTGLAPIVVRFSTLTLTISPDSVTLDLTDTLRFTAVVTDRHGDTVSADFVTWGSTNPSAVRVFQTGFTRAEAAGSATIHAAWGGAVGTARVAVRGRYAERLAFVTNRPGIRGIVTTRLDGSDMTLLAPTPGGFIDHLPVWSPDGTQLAFWRAPTSGAGRDIYVINADGTGLVNVTNDSVGNLDPAWHPDGDRIVFASNRDGDYDIWIMNTDGTGATQLSNLPNNEFHPSVSRFIWPSHRIAFSSRENGSPDVYVMHDDGTGQTRLTTDPAWDAQPAWSPDGLSIAFFSNRNGSAQIFVMAPDGSGQVAVTSGAADTNPAWAPDGSRLSFTRRVGNQRDIATVFAHGGGLLPITADVWADEDADWGRRVVFDPPPAGAGR